MFLGSPDSSVPKNSRKPSHPSPKVSSKASHRKGFKFIDTKISGPNSAMGSCKGSESHKTILNSFMNKSPSFIVNGSITGMEP
jgi:hypothetical protein